MQRSLETIRKLNYATSGPLGSLASYPFDCQRCGYPARDRADHERHRKAYHGKDVKHGISYQGLTGTWRVEVEGQATYLLSEEEARAFWQEAQGLPQTPDRRRGVEGLRF